MSVIESLIIAIAGGVALSLVAEQIGSYQAAKRNAKAKVLLELYQNNAFEVERLSEVLSKSQLWVVRQTAMRYSRRGDFFRVDRASRNKLGVGK